MTDKVVSADELLKRLETLGIPVMGIHIGDPDFPSTWVLDGVPDDQRQAALAALSEVITPAPAPVVFTSLAFLRLITADEYAALLNLEQQHPIDNAGCAYQLAILRASPIAYDVQDAQQLLACMVAAKVLTQKRADDIVSRLDGSQ